MASGVHGFGAVSLMLAVIAAPNMERADCANAADRYKAGVAHVLEALRAYESCIAGVVGRKPVGEPCAAEMQTLDNAHDDLADLADDLKDCR